MIQIRDPQFMKLPGRMRAKIEVQRRSGCWLWVGAKQKFGYGTFRYENVQYSTHRFAYEWLVGPIPEGLVIDHVKARGCTSPSCCNPDHLEPVTQGENARRGIDLGRVNREKTHCKRGHEFTPENTDILKGKWRRCRECRKTEGLAGYHRRKGPVGLPPSERTHCPGGHPYSLENTHRRQNGSRVCLACNKERCAEYRARLQILEVS